MYNFGQQVFGVVAGDSSYLFGDSVINLYNFGQQVFDTVAEDRNNLKINILTKERNANLDIFIYFTKKNQKINKNSFKSSG